jgi:hypothetical protein
MKALVLLLVVALAPLGCGSKPSEADKPDSKAGKVTKDDSDQDNADIRANLDKLSPDDRKLAEAQRLCPVANKPLGSMDVPVKLDVKGQPVFICCIGCKRKVEKEPDAILSKVAELKKAAQ